MKKNQIISEKKFLTVAFGNRYLLVRDINFDFLKFGRLQIARPFALHAELWVFVWEFRTLVVLVINKVK